MRTTTPRRGLSGQWGTRLTRVRVKKGLSSAYGAAHLDSHTSWRISWQGGFSFSLSGFVQRPWGDIGVH